PEPLVESALHWEALAVVNDTVATRMEGPQEPHESVAVVDGFAIGVAQPRGGSHGDEGAQKRALFAAVLPEQGCVFDAGTNAHARQPSAAERRSSAAAGAAGAYDPRKAYLPPPSACMLSLQRGIAARRIPVGGVARRSFGLLR